MKSRSETVLAIDIGTSGVRAALITGNGSVINNAQASYGFQCDDQTGVAEMDAELVFDRVCDVIKRCTSGLHTFVRCVSVASAMHSLVFVDGRGRPLTPLSIWMDTRAKLQCMQYRGIYERRHWHQMTGCLLSPSVPLARLLWYRDCEPGLFRKFSKAVSIKSYVIMRLLGVCVEDHSGAAGSGLLNVQAREWATEVLDYIGLDPVRLPELAGCQDVVYHGTPAGIEIDGLGPDTVWIAGGADGPLAHIASVGRSPNARSLTIGTSAAARRTSLGSMAERDNSVWCYPLDSQQYVVGQASNNGGAVIDWCLRTFFSSSTLLADLDEALLERRLGHKLIFLPFLYAERDCLVVQRPTPCFTGLRPEHRPLDFFQAVLEGVVFNALEMLTRLGSPGLKMPVVASGGVTRLVTVRRILSAVIPEVRWRPEGVDATIRGAAILGWESLGANQEFLFNDVMPLGEGQQSAAYLQKYKLWKEKAAALSHAVEG